MTWTVLPASGTPLAQRSGHRRWLAQQADRLFDFFGKRAIHPRGGFLEFDRTGQPVADSDPIRPIHLTCRMIFCHAIGHQMGRPGSAQIIDHGMQFLWNNHRDATHGGYFWSVRDQAPADASKQGYGHAFVLLAAASAKLVGHPLADALLTDITEILNTRFWDETHGAIREEFGPAWEDRPGYRGQNSNMHLTEALMAAFEATGNRDYLTKAERIASLIINCHARANGWRVAEHFTDDWQVDHAYDGHEMFRPSGTTPGHAFEWARLILQLHVLTGKAHDWMPEASEGLFRAAMAEGWDDHFGGIHYTVGWDGTPSRRYKLWWPLCEAAGAAYYLNAHRPHPDFEAAYRKILDVIAGAFIDEVHGGWQEQCSETLAPAFTLFPGKGDIYHALQACLIPLYPAEGGLVRLASAG